MIVGPEKALRWALREVSKKFDVKTGILGPDKGMQRELKFLNRRLKWSSQGITAMSSWPSAFMSSSTTPRTEE